MADRRRQPQVGDLAWHVDGLDPREVTKVEGSGRNKAIWIRLIGPEPLGPLPAANYTFTKPKGG